MLFCFVDRNEKNKYVQWTQLFIGRCINTEQFPFSNNDDPQVIDVFIERDFFLCVRKISHKLAHSNNRLSNGIQYNGRIVRARLRRF